MGRPRGDMRLSWWLILLFVWLAPAALASLGMFWSGWVAPALIRPRQPAAAERPQQTCREAEPADRETAAEDRLHRAIRLPSPPQAPGTPGTEGRRCVEHASA